jgi:LDH2 family malate/lactate/ureidoglycolate dehydrogenase
MELYTVSELVSFAHSLFLSAGCDDEKAKVIAEILIEADLMGHTTHGLALASNYLDEIERGIMLTHGDPKVLVDRGATIVWDGNYLPGVWLTASAVDLACERARLYGLCAIALRRSHHIACLSAYLQRATSHELMAIIASSDPSAASVAPYGGKNQSSRLTRWLLAFPPRAILYGSI